MYDITSRLSFENLSSWFAEIQNYANEKITIMLIGNKIDLAKDRKVTYEEGFEFA